MLQNKRTSDAGPLLLLHLCCVPPDTPDIPQLRTPAWLLQWQLQSSVKLRDLGDPGPAPHWPLVLFAWPDGSESPFLVPSGSGPTVAVP